MSSLQSNLLENHTPTGREEAWRFTPLKRLGGMHDGSATPVERNSLVSKGCTRKWSDVLLIKKLMLSQKPMMPLSIESAKFTSNGAVLAIAANTRNNSTDLP
jgi:Fe-S cluster assembly protein SufD